MCALGRCAGPDLFTTEPQNSRPRSAPGAIKGGLRYPTQPPRAMQRAGRTAMTTRPRQPPASPHAGLRGGGSWPAGAGVHGLRIGGPRSRFPHHQPARRACEGAVVAEGWHARPRQTAASGPECGRGGDREKRRGEGRRGSVQSSCICAALRRLSCADTVTRRPRELWRHTRTPAPPRAF